MLPLANSVWLLIIMAILIILLLVFVFIILFAGRLADMSYDDEDPEYIQYTNVRVLDKHPFDYNQLPRPYDYEVDG
jgi:hypothetical protein